MDYRGRITVADASGCRFQIHEYRDRRLFRTIRRLVLETGEAVRAVDEHTFELPSGERLVRIGS